MNATESVELIGTSGDGTPSALLTATLGSSGSKNAGNLTINTTRLTLADGAVVSVSSFDAGGAGRLEVNSDFIQLSGISSQGLGSGLYANNLSTGNAGNLTINTRELLIQNGAIVSVSAGIVPRTFFALPSFGPLFLRENLGINLPKILANLQFQPATELGDAGNLEISARFLKLDEGIISAGTESGRGGNIRLDVQDLILMRNSSEIVTSAANNGSGGNITINTPFIVAIPNENSDITADAEQGPGGRIRINATGIYGLEDRDRQTNQTSDITATSELGPEFSGIVELNTPDVDPSRGLVSLPVVPVDTQVVQACTPSGSQATCEFVVTGRGGLPPNPGESLETDAVIVDLAALNSEVDRPSTPSVSANSTSSTSAPIVEAQGWIIAANGEVVLTANVPTVTPHSSWQAPANCHVLKTSS